MTHFEMVVQKTLFPKPMWWGETSLPEPKATTMMDINDMVNIPFHHVLIN
jgi:hypothetical protein